MSLYQLNTGQLNSIHKKKNKTPSLCQHSPMKSQWCILRFSSSGLFRRLYLPMTRTWPEASVIAAVVLFLAWFIWWLLLLKLLLDVLLLCCCCWWWYGGGGVLRDWHCNELPGLPGSELGGVNGGTYMSREEAVDEGGEQKLEPWAGAEPSLA